MVKGLTLLPARYVWHLYLLIQEGTYTYLYQQDVSIITRSDAYTSVLQLETGKASNLKQLTEFYVPTIEMNRRWPKEGEETSLHMTYLQVRPTRWQPSNGGKCWIFIRRAIKVIFYFYSRVTDAWAKERFS